LVKVILRDSGEIVYLGSSAALSQDIAAWRETDCRDHAEKEWRRFGTSSGGVQIRQQCLNCGYVLGNPRKRQDGDDDIPEVDKAARDIFDKQRSEAYEDILQKHARLQFNKQNEWFREHAEYLQSDEWRLRRRLVLQRASGRCEGCGLNDATQVHHLKYDNWKAEFLFELVAICDSCHDRLHKPILADGEE